MGPQHRGWISKRRTAGIRLTPRSTNPYTAGAARGRSSMVEPQSSKLTTRVRFSSPAPSKTITRKGNSTIRNVARATDIWPNGLMSSSCEVLRGPARSCERFSRHRKHRHRVLRLGARGDQHHGDQDHPGTGRPAVLAAHLAMVRTAAPRTSPAARSRSARSACSNGTGVVVTSIPRRSARTRNCSPSRRVLLVTLRTLRSMNR